MTSSTIKDLAELLRKRRNLVLTGPPGTGKTHLAREIAKELTAVTGFVQFHPSYDYTDFVEGLRPTQPDGEAHIGFQRQDGIFKAFCKKALQQPQTNHVFVIDEINRGELSRILGELFFSIDPDYRGRTDSRGRSNCVQTQYQQLIKDATDPFYHDEKTGGGFFVPKNVYIIGTMNDIDRSVESMDFAIRRRFTWREVTAASTARDILAAADANLSPTQQEKTLRKMEALNDKIEERLGKEYQIGGAYFARLEGDNDEDFQKLWELHLHGLLGEYLRGRSDAGDIMEELKRAYGISQ